MPTFEITSTALPAPSKRAVVVRLTRWMADRGVQVPHVLVRFNEVTRNSVFRGGFPIDAGSGGEARYATVVCSISPDRDERFRDELADELTETLTAVLGAAFVYIEFRPTDSAMVYLALGGPARRVAELTTS